MTVPIVRCASLPCNAQHSKVIYNRDAGMEENTGDRQGGREAPLRACSMIHMRRSVRTVTADGGICHTVNAGRCHTKNPQSLGTLGESYEYCRIQCIAQFIRGWKIFKKRQRML